MVYPNIKQFFKEKNLSQMLLLFWIVAFLSFIFLIGYINFSASFFLSLICIIFLGLALSFYQWYYGHSSASLEGDYLLIKSPFKKEKIALSDIESFIENLELNSFLIKTTQGKIYSTNFDNSTYKRFCTEILRKPSQDRKNLFFTPRIYFSRRYLLTFILVACLPSLLVFCLFYQRFLFLDSFLACSLLIFMTISLWNFLRNIPIFYLFQDDKIVVKFFFKKKVVIILSEVERMIIALDKSRFCHCTFLLRDSSFYEISEIFSRKGFYLTLLKIKQSLNFITSS